MVAFFLSLLLMVADHRHHHLESARSILALVVAPLHYAADFPVSAGRWFADLFSTRDQLREQNDDLQRQNLLLQAQLQKLEALEAENIRLRDLLKSSAKVSDRILIAELLAVDLDPYKQQIVINKGRIAINLS